MVLICLFDSDKATTTTIIHHTKRQTQRKAFCLFILFHIFKAALEYSIAFCTGVTGFE